MPSSTLKGAVGSGLAHDSAHLHVSGRAFYTDDIPEPQDFLTTGHVWKYLDDGSDQGSAWSSVDFDDASWAEGASELGYGERDEATKVAWIDTDPEETGDQRNATIGISHQSISRQFSLDVPGLSAPTHPAIESALPRHLQGA